MKNIFSTKSIPYRLTVFLCILAIQSSFCANAEGSSYISRNRNGLIFPNQIDKDVIRSAYKDAFSGNMSSHLGYPGLYMLGWSDDGRYIGFMVEEHLEAQSSFSVESIIQDLQTDKIVWRDAFEIKEGDPKLDFNPGLNFFQSRWHTILEASKKYNITIQHLHANVTPVELETDRDGKTVATLGISSRKEGAKGFRVLANHSELGIKSIGLIDFHVKDARPMLIFTHANLKRAMVVVALRHPGHHGPPDFLRLRTFGLNLRTGFPRPFGLEINAPAAIAGMFQENMFQIRKCFLNKVKQRRKLRVTLTQFPTHDKFWNVKLSDATNPDSRFLQTCLEPLLQTGHPDKAKVLEFEIIWSP